MLTITATDFAFDVPAQVQAGIVTIHLINNGKEVHQAQLVRLEDGKTMADFGEAMKHQGPPPTWIKFVGGPNAVVPGGSVDGSVALSQGNYVVLCFIPSPDMKSHVSKGMIRPFEVTAQAGAADHLSGQTDTITVTEYAFTQTPTLTSGHHTILVRNAGAQDHEVVLVKLPPGVTVEAFAKWTDTMKGEPPGMPLGGVTALSSGESADFTVDLTPGDYAMICFVPDAKDGKTHYQHGMMTEFKVG
ncbi:MAG TPA: hypothetical protein VFU03_03150 [Gemmatimonadales bacterium]|nr:hypothetical protein [Gemmatimonadales bacterium]